MRAIRFHEHGDEDVLAVEDVERPEPGARDIVVENRAFGINHVDTLFREGIFSPPSMPAIPGSDFAGVVHAVGDEVTEFDVGDRVHGAGLGGEYPGAYAEFVQAPIDQVAHLPDAVSFTEGAAMSHVGVAAWQAVIDHGNLEPADTCLIHGGGGGVGHIAVQLAANVGATVVTTEADPTTREQLEDLGADNTLDFRRNDLKDAVLEVGRPDLIVDYFLDQYIHFDVEVAAHDGRISVLEYSTEVDGAATLDQNVLRMGLLKDVTIQLVGIFNGDISDVLSRLTDLYVRGDFSVEVAKTYELVEAPAAQRDIVEEVHLGKLVATI